MKEADLHAAVVQSLKLLLPADCVMHHSPNEGQRTPWAQAWIKKAGVRPGWPDLEFVYKGRVYFIELKSEKGRSSVFQAATQDALYGAGAKVKTCRTLNDVVETLTQWGIPLRGRVAA